MTRWSARWLIEGAEPDPVLGRDETQFSRVEADPVVAVVVEELRVVEDLPAATGAGAAVGPVRADPGDAAAGLSRELHERAGYGGAPTRGHRLLARCPAVSGPRSTSRRG